MKRLSPLALLLSFVFVAASFSTESFLRVERYDGPDFLGYVEDEFVVVLTPPARSGFAITATARGPVANDAGLQRVIRDHGVSAMEREFPWSRVEKAGSSRPDLTGHYLVRVPSATGRDAAMAAFAAQPSVDHVEKIGLHALHATPNDTYYEGFPNPGFPYDQWHYRGNGGIDADLAWDVETGDPSVVVGILDSGTRYFHLDLGGNSPQWGPGAPFAGGNIWINSAETPGNATDDDGNGLVDDTIGWDFVASAGGAGVTCIDQDCSGADNDPDDGDGHGTHVGGTVAAISNNGRLVAGVAGGFSDGTTTGTGNGVRILPLRIGYHARYLGQTVGVVNMAYAAQAMSYVASLIDDGVNVTAINCSWGSSNSGGLDAAVNALIARDVLIVHSAGNSNSSIADYLGGKAGVMNVAATGPGGAGASFSNYGSWVDVAAPGVEVLSTYRNPDDPDPTAHYIAVLDGTSMSSPHICGIAALLESCNPSLTATDKFNLIVNNTTPYSDTRDLGSGIANAKLAFDAAGCTLCDLAADFTVAADSGCAPFTASFSDASTGTGANSWTWDFGDGNMGAGTNPSHEYTMPGLYDVTLIVSDGACSDTLTRVGFVFVGDAPVAGFTESTTSGDVPLSVNFTDTSSGMPASWLWYFGDGDSATAQNPSHQYTTPGTYTVTLAVYNDCGDDTLVVADHITVADTTTSTAVVHTGVPAGERMWAYPNPFNPMTTIGFRLDRATLVRLSVYDPSGRLVRRLVQREMAAGVHTVAFDGRDDHGGAIASGVYFYRLETAGQSTTRKLVLLK